MAAFSASGSAVAAAAGAQARQAIGVGPAGATALATGAPAGVAAALGTGAAAGQPSTMIGAAAGTAVAEGFLSAAVAHAAGVASAGAVGAVIYESTAVETDQLIAVHGLTLVEAAYATSDASAQVAVLRSEGVAAETVELGEKRKAVAEAFGSAEATASALLEETAEGSGTATDTLLAVWKATEGSSAIASEEIEVAQRRFVTAAAAGTSAAAGRAVGAAPAVAAAEGSSEGDGVGLGPIVGAAAAAGSADAQGVAQADFAAQVHCTCTSSALALAKGRQVETLESTGFAEDQVALPLPSVYPIFWSNTIGAAGATWEALPFNSVVEQDGVIYAAGVGGICRLDDLADDNGAEVPADIQYDLRELDPRSDSIERSRSLYINAQATAPFTIRVSNKQGVFESQTHLPSSAKMTNHRAPLGRGIAARVARINLLQTGYFSVADASIVTGDTTRRV